jgi:hypothetical protein
MSGHDRRDLEEEAWCRFIEAGHYDVGQRWSSVLDWCGFYVPYAETGKSRQGKVNRLGVANAGRGGVIWDVAVRYGRITVPASLKAATDRDVTVAVDVAKALAAGGQPILTYLLRGTPENLEMRRIDAGRVLRDLPEGGKVDGRWHGAWFVRPNSVTYGSDRPVTDTTAQGFTCEHVPGGFFSKGRRWPFKVTRTYPRLRIEWSKVPDHLFYDAEWVPFTPKVPDNLWG